MPPKRASTVAKQQRQPKAEPESEGASGSESGSDAGEESGSDDDEPETKPVVPAKKVRQSAGGKRKSGANNSASTASLKKKNDKNNMAFPKGTYLVRLSDLGTERDHVIWRVDNHQLLQRYNRQQEDESSRYERTNRYTGWFCSEGFKYVELKVLEKENKEEKVRVRYPKPEELDAAKNKASEKQKEFEDGDDD